MRNTMMRAAMAKAFQAHGLDMSQYIKTSSATDWLDQFYGRQKAPEPTYTIPSVAQQVQEEAEQLDTATTSLEDAIRREREVRRQQREVEEDADTQREAHHTEEKEIVPIDEDEFARKIASIEQMTESIRRLYEIYSFNGNDPDVDNIISSLSELSDIELKTLGFTDSDIENFRARIKEILDLITQLKETYNGEQDMTSDVATSAQSGLVQQLDSLISLSQALTQNYDSSTFEAIMSDVRQLYDFLDKAPGSSATSLYAEEQFKAIIKGTQDLNGALIELTKIGEIQWKFLPDDLRAILPEDLLANLSAAEEFKDKFKAMFEDGTDAPSSLQERFNYLFERVQEGLPIEKAIERLENRAKSLGVTFDEISGKWVELQQETHEEAPQQEDETAKKTTQDFEQLKQTVEQVVNEVDKLVKVLSTLSDVDVQNISDIIRDIPAYISDIVEQMESFQKVFDFHFLTKDETFGELPFVSFIEDAIAKIEELKTAIGNLKLNINIGSSKTTMLQQSTFLNDALNQYKEAYEQLMTLVQSSDKARFSNLGLPIGKTSAEDTDKALSNLDIIFGNGNKSETLTALISQIELVNQGAKSVGVDLSEWEKQFEASAVAANKVYDEAIHGGTTPQSGQIEQLRLLLGGDQTQVLSETISRIETVLSSFASALSGFKESSGLEGETTQFQSLYDAINNINTVLSTKNELIEKELHLVEGSLPQEIELFQALEFAIKYVNDQLKAIIETLPKVKFDFISQDSTTKMTTLSSDIASLNNALNDLDGKDVFKHLHDILNTSDVSLTNNLDAIKKKFEELKGVMNGFDDNGVTVFKSLSDLANAGDQLVEKMQKLFKESGVKLPTVTQKQAQDKTRASELMATQPDEIRSAVWSDLERAPDELQLVSTKMEASGNGIVKVIAVVSKALEDGSLAFQKYTYEARETDTGISVMQKSVEEGGSTLERQAQAYQKFVDQMDKMSQKVEPIYDGKGKMMTITPETEGWEQLVKLAHRFGVEMEDAVKVTRIVQNGQESFQFDMRNGNAVRFGMNSNNILIEKNPIIDKKAEETAAKQRQKDVEELANSYLKLAEAQHKLDESRQKTGVADQRYVKEVNDLTQRQIELKERLGVLTEEEQKKIQTGEEYGRRQQERYGITPPDVDKEFGTAAQAYDTLIKKMKQYYSIIEKQNLGKPLTIGDQAFLQKYGTYFEQAGRAAKGASEDIGIFADKSQEALEAQERFRQETETMNANMVDRYETNLQSQISSLEPIGKDKTDIYNTKVVQVQEQFEKLQEIGAQIKLGNTEQAGEYLNLTKEIQGEINKINSGSYNFADPTKIAKLDRQIADWTARNSNAGAQYAEQAEAYRASLKEGLTDEEFSAVIQGFERTKAAAADAGSVGASFVDGLKQRIRSLGQYLLSFASFYRVIGVFKKAFTIVKDLDTAMTEMRKVSEESVETLSRYQFESFDMADKVGTTAKQIQDSTADWLRLGRTFEQSKTLAEQSTVLLNVSEFENINDATQALVSATQAYDELDAQTIIDKLNLIGNNFAVSTSDLAQGLQNAAAVLKTQGNDIDQSLALLTAGNLIGQDISKASMGIRTISLRISGTEEAKDEVKDMGEDIDDFVVRTKSKTDQIIRDYTAVASNAYKGVSVLDANGNLRDTYDILLDISKIYKEIQDEDKKNGTNRAQALVETLAGKTRSNIAASILLNGDVLEDVYNASANDYEGSAQRENEKYLDSIEGRIARLQNRLQELAFTSFAANDIKPIITFLTDAVGLATTLVDKVGLLPALIGSIGGAVLQYSGLGLFGKNGGIGFSGIIPALKQNKFFRQFGELKLNDVQSELFNREAFLNRDGAKSLIDVNEALIGSYGELTARQESYFLGLQNQGVKMVGVVEAQNALSDATFTFGSVMKGVSNIAAGFVSTLATMGVTMLAAFAMQAVIKGISDFVHHSENLINAGEEAKSTMSSVKQSMEETKESISGLSDEYAKLSTGVTVNGSTVKNLNLSEEEFTRYIELSNQIAQIAPELVTGYDNQGNAIVNLGNTIDDVNGKFEDYIRIQETIANGEYGKNLDSMWEGAEEQASKYRIEISNLESQLRDIVPQTVDGKTDAQITRQTKSFSFQTDAKTQARIEDALKSAGVLYNQPYLDVPSGLTTFNFDPDELAKLSDKQLQEINAAVSQTSYFNKADRQIIQAQQAKARLLLEKAYSDQIPYIQDYVRTNGLFDLVDDQAYAEGLQNSLVNMLVNVDYPSISSDVASKGGLRAWLDEFIASFLTDDGELKDALNKVFDLQEKRATMTYKEYAEQRNELFDQIADSKMIKEFGLDFYDLAALFGEATQDEEGIHWKTSERITSAAEKLNVESLGYSRDDFSKELQKYDSEYADAALSAIENIPQGKVSSIARSWESVWKYLEPYLTGKAVIKQEDPTDTLSQVFNADSFDVSNYTSKLSAVETALSSLYENGFLSDQEKVTLQDALPDLSDFDAESIKKAGGDVLKQYIKYIRDEASKFDLTEDAQRDLDTYVANLAKSYTSSVSAQSWGEILNDSVYSSLTGQNAASRYSGIISALGDRLQDSDAATIMLMLDADSTLANGSIEEIVEKWDEYKIQLGITLNDEEEARIKRELQHLETAQGLSDAMISSAEANGGRASKGQRQQAYDLAKAATREAEKYTQTQLDDYQRALGSGDEGYIRSIWDLVLQSRTDEEQKRQAETEALKALLESDANGLLEEEERLETEAGILQTQREHEEKFDGAASESTLKAIQKNDEDRQKNAKALADFFTGLAESDEYPQFSEDFIKSAADYLSKAFGFESDVFDDAMQHHQNAINALNDDLSRVQAQAQATSDALSLAEAQGRETTAADYQRQIDDAEDQIAVLIKQRREQLAIQRDLQGQEGTQAYKDAQAEVENLTSQIRQLQVEQVNAQKAIGEIPMLHLQADQTSLEEASQSLQDELSDPRNAPTVDVYVNLIANADDQISNLEQQRAELQRKMAEAENRQGFSVYDTDYVEYRSRLAEVDSQIRQVTQSQLEWRKAILEMPLDKINQQLEEYADKISRISAARELSEASGRATTEKDYLAEMEAYQGEADTHRHASILRGFEAARLIADGYSIDSEEVRSVMSQRNQEYTSWMSSRTSALQAKRSADELNLGRIQDQIGLLEQSASQLNDVISLAEARGQAVGALDYQRLIGNADAQIAQNEQLISEYETLMAKWTPEQGSEIWKTYVEGIDNATSQITQLQQSQVEWHDTIMQLGLTDLQNEQADLERQITVAEQEHHKVSEKTYRDLLKNGERQIKNLRAQQRGLDKMEPKYREIQSQIDQVSDSMREWENTADHLALTAGQNLSSAITSAMSEINSETGLTRDTMDSLLQSFDDLTAYDLSGLFYESADGMKLNVGMAQDLIDARYELTMSGYEKTIAEQNKIIAENTGLQDENAQAALAAAQRRKLAAEQDMAMYQAQYNVQNQALSSFQAWQNATQTKNAGANYETYQSAWKGIQEAYTKGLTGTDDFRTYVAFFDRWGQDTVEAYERNKQKISRYITEGSTGVDNFIKDLVAKGYGKKNAEGGYDVSLSDVEDISRDLQISEDAVKMMINRGEDYGWIVTMVDTVQEGGLKISDTTHDLIQETLRYQEMLANGATADELKNQKDYIDELTTSIGDYTDSINELDEEHGKITSTRLQTELDKISALQQFLDNEELTAGMPEGVKAKFEEDINEAIQQISDETGIPLKVNADTSNFEVDQEKLQQQFDGFKPKITIDEITDESFTNARKELTEIPSLTEAAEDVLGVGENDLMGSAFTKFQEGWEDNKESLGDYIDQLNGLNLSQEAIDNIETLDFADGGYTDGLEEFESILDNVAKMFGITADEAQYLLPILEALGLVNITGNAQTWTKPISAIMGTEVGALDSWIRKNENAEVDLDFDPTEMSVDELGEKIKEISKLKVQIDADPEAGDEVKTQYKELMHSLTQQYGIQKKVDRMYQMTGLTADDFLDLNEDDQKRVMIDIGVNPEDYDSFIESAQNQSIKVKIQGALKDGHTIEELLNMSDEDLAKALDISMDEESIAAAKEMLENISMEPYKTAGQTIADQIEDKSSSIGSKIGTGFIEAVTGFIDLLTGGDEETDTSSYNTLPKSTIGDTSIPGVTSFGAQTASSTASQTGQGKTVVNKQVTELSVEGARESEAEVADYTKTIEEIPTSKKTTITTTREEINRTTTENNVVSNYKMPSSEITNNISKETKSSGGTINVSVNVQGQEQVDALKQSIDSIEGKNVDVRASVYGIGTVSTLNNEISKVTGRDVSINANVNGFALVSGLVSKMNELKDKTVTITTQHLQKSYTGTVTGTPYTAHASGTAYNMLNLTPKTEANAAGNDVSIQKTGKSLVNELGQESIIRDGKWYLLPGGMHVETLKRGDIVLNHLQTEALLHNRIAPGTGELYGKFEDVIGANAGGTLGRALMSAHSKITVKTDGSHDKNGGSGDSGGKSGTGNTGGNNNNKGKGTDKGKSAIDKFKEWLESLFDWIEVRVERLQYDIDLYQAKAENAIGYGGKHGKNSFINKAMNVIGKLGNVNEKTGKVNSKGSGLLFSAQRGAIRYQQQADQVYDKAVKGGLISKKDANVLVKKIQEGVININEYGETKREFISAYKEWYDKGQELTAQIEELKQQLKELEQTKLDNITEQFEGLAGYSEALNSAAKSTIDYYEMVGNEVNGKYTKDQVVLQQNAQADVVKQLKNEYLAYNDELKKAKKIFGAKSVEYKAAQTELVNIRQSYVEAKTALKELNETADRLDISRIDLYIDRLKEMGSRMANVVSYGEARGTKVNDKNSVNPFLTEGRYQAQYNNNIKLMDQYRAEIDKQNALITDYGYQMGSNKYNEAFQVIEQAEQEILSLAASNEQLQDAINELRWKPFVQLQEQVKNTISDVDYLRGLMGEGEFFNTDATITKRGYANIALLGDSLEKTKQLTRDYVEALDILDREYKSGTISLEEFNEKSRQYVELIKSSVTETKNYEKALIEMYKTQITMENDILQKNIDLRQKALQTKKSYYDYDKQIKDKSKDIITLQAQIAALSGVTNQAGVAERQRLMAQLQQAQEELKDTQYNHRVDTINQGYESLSEDAQKNLDDELEALDRNADEQERVVNMMLDKIKTAYEDAYAGINDIIEGTGVTISNSAQQGITSIKDLIAEIEKLKESASATSLINKAKEDPKDKDADKQVANINTSATKSTIKKSNGKLDEDIPKRAATALTNSAAGKGASTANTQAEKNANTNKSVTNPNKDLYDAVAAKEAKEAADKKAAEDKKKAQEAAKKKKEADNKKKLNNIIAYIKSWKNAKSGVSMKGKHPLYKYIYEGGLNGKRDKLKGATPARQLKIGQLLGMTNLPKDASKLTKAQKDEILKKLKAVGYAQGTKSLEEDDGRYWTHEGELIIRKSDGAVLTPMTKGSTVIPANLADNLFKWGAIDPDKFISNPFMRKKEDVKSVYEQAQPTNVQIGSLFTIQGNVDSGVMDRLEDLGKALTSNKNFQQNVVNLVTKEYVRESRKLGMR